VRAPVPTPSGRLRGRKRTQRRNGIRRHSTRSLPPVDITTRLRIRCTTVERVLIDLAALRSPELERAVEEGFVNKLIGRTRMQEALDRANGRAGTPQLRRLLAGLLPQPGSTTTPTPSRRTGGATSTSSSRTGTSSA